MQILIIRPSTARVEDTLIRNLLDAFRDMTLVDKTVCEDRIVYIFKNK